jgi:fructose-1,6-bisphosphatase II / sedoheptulose-1,7-bisphosphatase
VYTLEELASGNVIFAATGVTTGTMLQGLKRIPGGVVTQSISMNSATGTVRTITAEHRFASNPRLARWA